MVALASAGYLLALGRLDAKIGDGAPGGVLNLHDHVEIDRFAANCPRSHALSDHDGALL
jgi:hypothetical protein